jgi:hypothetical protein
MTQAEVAKAMNDPTSAVAKQIDGGTNADIAAICLATGNQPTSVCSSSVVSSLETTIIASSKSGSGTSSSSG